MSPEDVAREQALLEAMSAQRGEEEDFSKWRLEAGLLLWKLVRKLDARCWKLDEKRYPQILRYSASSFQLLASIPASTNHKQASWK